MEAKVSSHTERVCVCGGVIQRIGADAQWHSVTLPAGAGGGEARCTVRIRTPSAPQPPTSKSRHLQSAWQNAGDRLREYSTPRAWACTLGGGFWGAEPVL
eukprot:TRINITY_DN30273_c1_g1_i1.p3 TRINITY_DN30273_c1_g1~~TRINITY_DN30273_c1_g1_i1.p3  ORF type:complete len:100 (-),score=2.75 TRINITY_DN30273_c1_g1_i1:1396-1695(-)